MEADATTLLLRLDPERLERHCAGVLRATPDPARAVAAFAALKTLLAELTDPGQQAGSAYPVLREVLDRHLAEAEDRLHAEHAGRLAEALHARSPEGVAAVHGRLSRSAFRAMLDRLPPEQAEAGRRWAAEWLRETERAAQAASGYPDAFDFVAAGIAVTTYAAMKDLSSRQ